LAELETMTGNTLMKFKAQKLSWKYKKNDDIY